MPRVAPTLPKSKIAQLKEEGFHAVGGTPGLHLRISRSGARSWVLRVSTPGGRRDIGLGGYDDVPVDDAREAARVMRLKVKEGIDPLIEKRANRVAAAAEKASALTFKQAAQQYIQSKEAGWKNAKHAAQWTSTLEKYAFPVAGNLLVRDIDTACVLRIIEPIWTSKTETASRVRGRIESVLDWAKVRGYRTGDNPARWKGHLDHLLSARKEVAAVRNHAALDYRRIGQFMAALRVIDGMGAKALEFAVLTACRSGEVRGMRWSEFDEKAGVWIVPAERMKAKKEHRVPLQPAALQLLANQPKMAGTDLVFPNAKNDQLSDMTLTAVIKRMHESSTKAGGEGWTDSTGKIATAHGFRSTFRDWAGECTNHPREVIEHALAHQLKDKVEAAYQRGDLLVKRLKLMTDWSAFCSKMEPAAVLTLTAVEVSKEAA